MSDRYALAITYFACATLLGAIAGHTLSASVLYYSEGWTLGTVAGVVVSLELLWLTVEGVRFGARELMR